MDPVIIIETIEAVADLFVKLKGDLDAAKAALSTGDIAELQDIYDRVHAASLSLGAEVDADMDGDA